MSFPGYLLEKRQILNRIVHYLHITNHDGRSAMTSHRTKVIELSGAKRDEVAMDIVHCVSRAPSMHWARPISVKLPNLTDSARNGPLLTETE